MAAEFRIEARNITMQPEWKERIEKEIERLQRHFTYPILYGRVTIVGAPHHRHGAYEVRIAVDVPGDTVVVEATGDLEYPMLTQVFDALQRRLEERARRWRGEVKQHAAHERSGCIVKLDRGLGFGFIRPIEPGDCDVYFHQHAVHDVRFSRLVMGQSVAYAEEAGDDGPQAVWVRPRST